MLDEADTETTNTATPPDTGRPTRPWPMWLVAGITAVAMAAAVLSVVTWRSAEQAADDAEAHVAAQAARVDQLNDELEVGELQIAENQAQVQTMRAILQPATPAALQGVYLQLVQAGCADPTADVEALITDVATEVSSDSTLLAGRAGWEAAIDRDAVTEAIANCEPTDG